MPTSDKATGFLVLDKPIHWSSMRAVSHVRRRAGGVRTGHAGTLDPLATGVLILGLGPATRRLGEMMALPKQYRTTIDLSAFTTTDDREGERTEVSVDAPPSRAAVEEALQKLTGTIEQRPPAFSAMKVGGRRAYKMARNGETVELPPRPVSVHAIRLERYEWPEAEILVDCGKGTYIRSLARDLGLLLETGGHCRTLRRTAIGRFDESMARTPEELPEVITTADLIAPDIVADAV